MPSLLSFDIADRESTPVSTTMNPAGSRDGVQTFVSDGDVVVGRKTMTFSTSDTGTYHRVRVVFREPILVDETINGVTRPSVEGYNIAELSLKFRKGANDQERKNFVGLLTSALADGHEADAVLTEAESWY